MEKLRKMLGGMEYKEKLIGLLQIIVGNVGYALVVQLFILPMDLLTAEPRVFPSCYTRLRDFRCRRSCSH